MWRMLWCTDTIPHCWHYIDVRVHVHIRQCIVDQHILGNEESLALFQVSILGGTNTIVSCAFQGRSVNPVWQLINCRGEGGGANSLPPPPTPYPVPQRHKKGYILTSIRMGHVNWQWTHSMMLDMVHTHISLEIDFCLFWSHCGVCSYM